MRCESDLIRVSAQLDGRMDGWTGQLEDECNNLFILEL